MTGTKITRVTVHLAGDAQARAKAIDVTYAQLEALKLFELVFFDRRERTFQAKFDVNKTTIEEFIREAQL